MKFDMKYNLQLEALSLNAIDIYVKRHEYHETPSHGCEKPLKIYHYLRTTDMCPFHQDR